MLGGDARGRAVGAAEHDRDLDLPARHIGRLRRRIDELIHRLHGEIEGHEFDDGFQSVEGRADADAGKAVFGDRRVDDAPRAEFFQQPLRDFIGALIFGDLFAHHEHVGIAAHFFRHGVAQGFAHRHGDELGAFRHFGLGQPRLPRRCGAAAAAGAGACGAGAAASAGFGALARRGLGVFQGGRILAVGEDHGDRRIDRDVVGAFRHQNLAERALVDRFHFHGGFVGLDLGDHVAGFDGVALFLEPLGEIALLHRRRQGGHQNLSRHDCSLGSVTHLET